MDSNFPAAPILFAPFGLFGVFLLIFGAVFVFVVFRGMAEWSRNNASPILDQSVLVVAKRIEVSNRSSDRTWTNHYATFELENGERLEFSLSGSEYGMLAEGDRGTLTSQGTRYKGFQRATPYN